MNLVERTRPRGVRNYRSSRQLVLGPDFIVSSLAILTNHRSSTMLHFTAPFSALPTIVLLFFFAIFTATYFGQVGAYQYIPPDSPIIRGTFSPYAQGFTGYYGEPSDPRRYPVNPGNPLSPDQPLRFTGVNGRQNCPGMIGPLDGMYYCTDKAFGYCDRRSGACFCGGGYTIS